jgi:hypothetical protein
MVIEDGLDYIWLHTIQAFWLPIAICLRESFSFTVISTTETLNCLFQVWLSVFFTICDLKMHYQLSVNTAKGLDLPARICQAAPRQTIASHSPPQSAAWMLPPLSSPTRRIPISD